MNRLALILLVVVSGCGDGRPDQPVNWTTSEGYRSRPLAVEGDESAGFRMLTRSGIDFVNRLSDDAIVANRNRMNGSGVAVGDVDGDGLPDVFLAGLEGPDALYLNRGGWSFDEVTAASGLPDGDWSTGAVFADTDGDGDLDLLVTDMTGPNRLHINDGSGRFTRATGAGIGSNRGSMSAAFADTDGDGDLDLYVANYKRIALSDSLPPDVLLWDRMVIRGDSGAAIVPELADHYRLEVIGDQMLRLELGEADSFLENDGGRFSPMAGAATAGSSQPLHPGIDADWGLSVRLQDLNADGAPDLYVSNDFESPDYIWMNDGAGGFRPLPASAFGHTSNSSMSMDAADVDRDGRVDLFVSDMLSLEAAPRRFQMGTPAPIPVGVGDLESMPQYMHNTLFMARGDESWAEAAWAYGVAATGWSWSTALFDVDLDGWEDLLVTTGHSFDVQDADAQMNERDAIRRVRSVDAFRRLILDYPTLNLKNAAFRNVGGTRFEAVKDGWGIGLTPDITHGMAFGDLDGDGDLDAVANRLNAPAGVYENRAAQPRVAIRLIGVSPNTHGIGARVTVESGPGGLSQTREAIAGGQYLSGSEALLSFAAFSDSLTIVVRWRSGRTSTLVGARANRLYEIDESSAGLPDEAALVSENAAASAGDFYRDVTELAPHRPSTDGRSGDHRGPPVAAGDLDGDGDLDVVIGAAEGDVPAIYMSEGDRLVRSNALFPAAIGDWTGAVVANGCIAAAETTHLVVYCRPSGPVGSSRPGSTVGSTRSEPSVGSTRPGPSVGSSRSEPSTLSSRPASWEIHQSLALPAMSGPVVAADTDQDGDMDLFVGTRGARYPESGESLLFTQTDTGLSIDARFDVGLVTGASFGDADGDGDADLVLATDWGPIRLLENDGTGLLREAEWSPGQESGRWRAVALADLDGDGADDLVATNWGWNSPLGGPDSDGRGPRLYWGDLDADGTIEAVESVFRADLNAWSPLESLPNLRGEVTGLAANSFHDYATKSSDVLFPQAAVLTATTLGHSIWLNRGGTFEQIELPPETQWAPASGVAVLDANSDGHVDVALAQNVYRDGGWRQDSGSGLILLGDGMGGFRALPLGIEGEQRGIAAVAGGLVVGRNGLPAIHIR